MITNTKITFISHKDDSLALVTSLNEDQTDVNESQYQYFVFKLHQMRIFFVHGAKTMEQNK